MMSNQTTVKKRYNPFRLLKKREQQGNTKLHVRVIRGRNITKGWAADAIDTPDPYVQVNIPGSRTSSKKTSYKNNEFNPQWDETFKFHIDLKKAPTIEVSLWDANFFRDENLGYAKLKLADLPFQEKKMITFSFKTDFKQRRHVSTKGKQRSKQKVSEVDVEFYVDYVKDKTPLLKCLSVDDGPQESDSFKDFDPFQIFEVQNKPPQVLTVNVKCGRNITKGWKGDLIDTPDPYVTLAVATAPNRLRKTTYLDNDVNPVWNEQFKYILDPDKENVLEINLMDANYTVDEVLGSRMFQVSELVLGVSTEKTFTFNETSEVDFEFLLMEDNDVMLRYSLALCQEEKTFKEVRKEKVFYNMQQILGDKAPQTLKETPTIGVLGSGGGFRAMCAFSGVFKALVDTQILDMVTYAAGLSGSSWYLAQLYSHPDWPRLTPGELQNELRNDIDHTWVRRLFSPESMYRYIDRIINKKKSGQPVSFTDFFGHLIGDTLLKNRLTSKLSDWQGVVEEGNVPMPLCTCLHVKKQVSALVFHEWVEFTPYEIGLPKYGTFMRSDMFGSKFFLGHLVKRQPEPPLHFLMGIWGSAFCILFKRLLKDDKSVDPAEMIRREKEDMDAELMKEEQDDDDDSDESEDEAETTAEPKQDGFWKKLLDGVFSSGQGLLGSRAGRAGMVHNFMRGLSVNHVYPFSPFSPIDMDPQTADPDTFDGIFEMYCTHLKTLYMVDSGLTFNSPYPLLLRPQRSVDLILSFDFSARPTDDTPPFKELKLAEQWARLNLVPFPPIDVTVFEREGMKECYVFKDPEDPYCPVVLHFTLVNKTFRKDKQPGVPRVTEEELKAGEFSIFEDPRQPFSTFNFTYAHEDFDRLTSLTEFNTLLNVDLIKENIERIIQLKSTLKPKPLIELADVRKLRHTSRRSINKLSQYLKHNSKKLNSMAEEGVEFQSTSDRKVELKSTAVDDCDGDVWFDAPSQAEPTSVKTTDITWL